jgi:hypothetical protein
MERKYYDIERTPGISHQRLNIGVQPIVDSSDLSVGKRDDNAETGHETRTRRDASARPTAFAQITSTKGLMT